MSPWSAVITSVPFLCIDDRRLPARAGLTLLSKPRPTAINSPIDDDINALLVEVFCAMRR